MDLDGAAREGGELDAATPGHLGVELPVQQERGRAMARRELGGRVTAKVLDQLPAELALDELIAEGDASALSPGPRALLARPGEEQPAEIESGRQVEPGHD